MLRTRDNHLQGLENIGENKLLHYSRPFKKTNCSANESDIEWHVTFRNYRGNAVWKRLVNRLQRQIVRNENFNSSTSEISHISSGESRSILPKTPPFIKIDRKVGVASLEKKNEDYRQKNENIMNAAFTDLYMLMLSAEQVLAFANSHQNALTERALSSEDFRKHSAYEHKF